jgi:glycosyltransferase involved in cell wall biosynthesis
MSQDETIKPKILFIGPFPPPIHGGSLMNSFVAKSTKLNSQFAIRTINTAPPQPLEDAGRFSIGKLFGTIALLARISVALMRFRPRVVYLTPAPTGFAFYRDLAVVLLVRAASLRRVLHIHGQGFAPNTSMPRWRRTLVRLMFNGSSVILLSPRLAQEYSSFIAKDLIYIVRNGIPDPFPNGVNISERAVPPRVLFIGNLIESKGPIVLLQALAELKREGQIFGADVVGAWYPPLTQSVFIKRLQDLKLMDIVKLHGPVYGEKKYKLLSDASIFAFPTFYPNEAFPLVILEAMAAGLAVISTRHGGIPDMIIDGETGLLVPPRKIAPLVSALRSAITDPILRIRLGQAARAAFERQYNLVRFEMDLTTVFSRCIA